MTQEENKDENPGCDNLGYGCLKIFIMLAIAIVLFIVLVCKHGWDGAVDSYWGELWDIFLEWLKISLYVIGGILAIYLLGSCVMLIKMLIEKLTKLKKKQ